MPTAPAPIEPCAVVCLVSVGSSPLAPEDRVIGIVDEVLPSGAFQVTVYESSILESDGFDFWPPEDVELICNRGPGPSS